MIATYHSLVHVSAQPNIHGQVAVVKLEMVQLQHSMVIQVIHEKIGLLTPLFNQM
jgi:hypothetical protein